MLHLTRRNHSISLYYKQEDITNWWVSMEPLQKPAQRKYNPKRTILSDEQYLEIKGTLEKKSADLKYDGKPEHKRAPVKYGFPPPTKPREAKTFCDDYEDFTLKCACKLLRKGFLLGMHDARTTGDGWPKHIWAVSEKGTALEAKPSGGISGTYHGYPMVDTDPLKEKVLKVWKQRTQNVK